MAQQPIDVGAVANDGTGDPLRIALQKTNDNFTELYYLQSKTINAGSISFVAGNPLVTQRIQAAINFAVTSGAAQVYVPADMLPYDSTLITFSDTVRMVREGGDSSQWDVHAYGAYGNSTGNDTTSFQAAGDGAWQSGGGRVVARSGLTYRITTGLIIRGLGVVLELGARGSFFSGATLVYDGAVDDTFVMVTVANTAHGAGVVGGVLDANSKAGICLQYIDDGAGGSTATFGPIGGDTTFRGYRKRGLVLGPNTSETTPVASNMTMGVVNMPNLWFQGGVLNAIGILINAQNAEWSRFPGLYMDPGGDTIAHKHHIFALRGGLALEDCITTRAVDYAIIAYESARIAGWNSEDRYLLKTTVNDPGGSVHLSRLLQRDHPGPSGSPAFGDITFDFYATADHYIHMDTVTVQGSIRITGSDLITVVGTATFAKSALGAGWIFAGPYNQRGMYYSPITGEILLRGPTAAFRLFKNDTVYNAPVLGLSLLGVQCPSFTSVLRPGPGTVAPGTVIWNSTQNLLNISNGGNWTKPDGTDAT